MTRRLRDEIKQTRPFASREQEAYLSVGRTWSVLEHALSEALKPHGITPTQYNVLRILRGAGERGLCRSEVMERMIARVCSERSCWCTSLPASSSRTARSSP